MRRRPSPHPRPATASALRSGAELLSEFLDPRQGFEHPAAPGHDRVATELSRPRILEGDR